MIWSCLTSEYFTRDSRWWMQLSRAFFLSAPCTTHQRDSGRWVRSNITSLALVYSSQRFRDSMSIGLSFHCFRGSLIRHRKRNSCSSSGMENQYLTSWMPERTSIFSNSGTVRKNSSYSASVQNPITRSRSEERRVGEER